jgi:hypothetical protein
MNTDGRDELETDAMDVEDLVLVLLSKIRMREISQINTHPTELIPWGNASRKKPGDLVSVSLEQH